MAEKLTEQNYLRQGYRVVGRRWKTPFGEVDLWLAHPQKGWLAIEVKSLRHPDHILNRVGAGQARRLRRILLWLCENYRGVRFRIVYVLDEGKCIELGLEDLPIRR